MAGTADPDFWPILLRPRTDNRTSTMSEARQSLIHPPDDMLGHSSRRLLGDVVPTIFEHTTTNVDRDEMHRISQGAPLSQA